MRLLYGYDYTAVKVGESFVGQAVSENFGKAEYVGGDDVYPGTYRLTIERIAARAKGGE